MLTKRTIPMHIKKKENKIDKLMEKIKQTREEIEELRRLLTK